MDIMTAGGTLGYALLGLTIFGGLLTYLGTGAIVTRILGALAKKVTQDENKPWKGIPRRSAWITTLGWPLLIAAAALFIAWAIGVIGAIIVFVLAVVAGIIAVILAIIVFVLAVVACIIAVILAIIALILALIIAVVAFFAALVVIVLLAFLILSPLFSIGSLENIVTKLHPTGNDM